jgi:uncharacterized surface anchored protein
MEGDPGNETTLNGENGARFRVWLKSAGSYDAALPTERDIITTEPNPSNGLDGYGITKLLPYGVYCVRQLPPDNGTNPVPDFEVFIDKNLKLYSFYKWNGPTVAYIQMAKRDSETEELIPLANAGFKLWDYQTNDWYSVRTTYPSPIVHDIFYTDNTGTFTMPEPLSYGRYRWVEVTAPYGYVNPIALDSGYTGVNFSVDENMQVEDGSYMLRDNIPVFLVNHYDQPQKARIGIDKFGEQFSDITITQSEFGSVHTPVFTRQRLAGCTFVIRAKTDILTPEGTIRYAAGQVVDTLTTSATETVYSKLLYLGEYEVTEESAPEGFINEDTVRDVVLEYRGELIVSFDQIEAIDNARGQVKLTLEKQMEAQAGNTSVPYDKVKYGLFAAQDFTDCFGSVRIHKGDLMDILSLDDTGRYESTVSMLWGQYMLRELATGDLYRLDPEEYIIDVQPDTRSVTVTRPDGSALVNELNRARIRVIKTDGETNTPLEGAVFEVRDAAGNIAAELVTGPDGTAETGRLPAGRYTIAETSAPRGYIADDKPIEVFLSEHEKVYEVEIQNRRLKATVRVFKYDGTDGKAIHGVVFGIYGMNEELLEKLVTDHLGYAVSSPLEYGEYAIAELEAAPGYIPDYTPFAFAITEDGETYDLRFRNEREPQTPENPKTGGRFPLLPLCAGGAVTACVLAGAAIRKKKRGK